MKKLFVACMVIISLTFFVVVSVSAIDSGTPIKDTYVEDSQPSQNNQSLAALASGSFTSCDATSTIFMAWDLTETTADSSVVHSADLDLRVNNTSGNTSVISIALFGIPDGEEGWNENMADGDADVPTTLTAITGFSQSGPFSAGQTVTFSSINNDALSQYLTNKIASGVGEATIAMQINSCPFGFFGVEFDDNAQANPPTLNMYTSDDATAVHLITLQSADSNTNPTLLLMGIGGLLLVSMAVFILMRRRQPQA
ncbi:MAG: hypothetical protein H6662_03430 [Ardenticatenaceae bacterium]|nr:hypothetical protein [Anaerolineales bacterium]MCB8920613.1 hypothetical protein [Ardenticatenaceae bacterium]MCB8990237.1 hypothetical protein [Ardenticatenaceae bacterium]MCB9002971.1 hypothetical protein [Ardenticatenaceae bacterium]